MGPPKACCGGLPGQVSLRAGEEPIKKDERHFIEKMIEQSRKRSFSRYCARFYDQVGRRSGSQAGRAIGVACPLLDWIGLDWGRREAQPAR
jgi:hypothetical protein